MQNIHKLPHLQKMLPASVPSPSASDAQGSGMPGGHPPGPGRRQPPGKPMSGMMPPPSPAMSVKTLGGSPKQEDGVPLSNNDRVDVSPQNAAMGIGGQAPGGPGSPGPAGTQTTAPPTPTASAMTPWRFESVMANHPPPLPPPSVLVTDGLNANSFGIDFPAGQGNFDPSLFNGDSSINLERDFAAWFDPENAA